MEQHHGQRESTEMGGRHCGQGESGCGWYCTTDRRCHRLYWIRVCTDIEVADSEIEKPCRTLCRCHFGNHFSCSQQRTAGRYAGDHHQFRRSQCLSHEPLYLDPCL